MPGSAIPLPVGDQFAILIALSLFYFILWYMCPNFCMLYITQRLRHPSCCSKGNEIFDAAFHGQLINTR